ncbi:hypothetical protein [Pseudoalteromonas rubra]|uniref:Uncharacterized protein n=1 Tax=Pseudoalteromonas rubra TaxID=43658 RepID=A0A5S3X701_9GAMM|nr:hypothetical protein [Pseudoalteromonas rubra]TMP39887.1 hypothetical protein CWB98_01060 [Pseudoalteromonas rubra]
MPDPLTIAGAGLAVLGSKDVLTKILGPSADYVGGELAGFIKKCNINLDGIFAKAEKKLGSRIDSKGGVNPRVLRHILDDGRFCEEDITAEYYGGLLAGSREENSENDYCLPFLSKVKEMPTHQLRLHFSFYYEVLRLHKAKGVNLGHWYQSGNVGLVLTLPFIHEIFPHEEQLQSWELMVSAIVGLHSLGLISNNFAYGEPSDLRRAHPHAHMFGAYVEPSLIGAELFLWALGASDPNAHRFFELDINKVDKPIDIPEGAIAMHSLDDIEKDSNSIFSSINK